MNKKLIIGLDLSFSCTGITISYLEDNIGKKMKFHRVLFDNQKSKKGKIYSPTKIQNISDTIYRMPTNILVDDIVIDKSDENNIEQCEITLKAVVSSKKIEGIIKESIDNFQPDEIIISVENYIMPDFNGPNNLKSVSGSIMLQGYVREKIIRICIDNKLPFKLLTVTPSSLKLFFAKHGSADKLMMLQKFMTDWDGKKLLPTVDINMLGLVNDVIDSFALMMYAYKKIINQ